MNESSIEYANREFNNLSTMALWQVELDQSQAQYLKDNRPAIVICHGQFRKVVFKEKCGKIIMSTIKD